MESETLSVVQVIVAVVEPGTAAILLIAGAVITGPALDPPPPGGVQALAVMVTTTLAPSDPYPKSRVEAEPQVCVLGGTASVAIVYLSGELKVSSSPLANVNVTVFVPTAIVEHVPPAETFNFASLKPEREIWEISEKVTSVACAGQFIPNNPTIRARTKIINNFLVIVFLF